MVRFFGKKRRRKNPLKYADAMAVAIRGANFAFAGLGPQDRDRQRLLNQMRSRPGVGMMRMGMGMGMGAFRKPYARGFGAGAFGGIRTPHISWSYYSNNGPRGYGYGRRSFSAPGGEYGMRFRDPYRSIYSRFTPRPAFDYGTRYARPGPEFFSNPFRGRGYTPPRRPFRPYPQTSWFDDDYLSDDEYDDDDYDDIYGGLRFGRHRGYTDWGEDDDEMWEEDFDDMDDCDDEDFDEYESYGQRRHGYGGYPTNYY